MIIKKIAFTKTFPILINGQWEKHYTEADIEPGDDIRQCRYKLKKEIEEFFFESKAAAEKQMGTQVTDATKNDEVFNQEWEDIKAKLLSFDSKEDAQAYLDTTTYNMTINAKQIINSIKSKNEKK